MTDYTDLGRALGRLEGKMDMVLDHLEAMGTASSAQDTRLRSLERWRSWLAGGVAALTAIIGLLLRYGHPLP